MLAAVDLYKLAATGSAQSRLMHLGWPELPRNPHPRRHLKASDRLLGHINAVACPELLGGQRRPKIGVLVPQDRQNTIPELAVEHVVARSVELPRGQTDWTLGSVPVRQALNLAAGEAETLGGSA